MARDLISEVEVLEASQKQTIEIEHDGVRCVLTLDNEALSVDIIKGHRHYKAEVVIAAKGGERVSTTLRFMSDFFDAASRIASEF